MSGGLRLLLLVGLAAIGIFLVRGLPRDVTLVYALDGPADVRALEVDVRRDGEILRHAEYRFPGGAPGQVRHELRLPDGAYEVLVRVSRDGGAPRRSLLPVVVSESGPIVLAVHEAAPRPD